MKILKLIWTFLSGLFKKPLTEFELQEKRESDRLDAEVRAKVKEGLRRKMMSNVEKRYEWLEKTGYTSRVHIAPDLKPDKELSHFRAMVNKAKNIGEAMRKDGQRVIHTSKFKNKYGICLMTYFPKVIPKYLKISV